MTLTASWSGWEPLTATSAGDHLTPPSVNQPVTAAELFFCGFSENSSSSFLSTLVCPEPMATAAQALRLSLSGLLLPQDLQRLIQELRCDATAECFVTLQNMSSSPPRLSCRSHLDHHQSWVSLTVHGFVDSPVSWGGREHGVLKGGENFYTLLMFPDQTYQLYLGTGAQDASPP